ncbi:Uu.00g091360.m01.CDS01 [Anthostomella pinea]|uniref:Uu.00g091360.m01.CDS01 n=1 Tax=Anthostomella pinea TaxID=933095 RepID=A0AAI8YKC6_9PEZI|nr:Uu.00g091360.m01.CDS01 [Anthostomella pinea]
MAMVADQSYNMFPRPNHEQDFMLYPEPPTQTSYASPAMGMGMSPDSFAFSRGAHDDFPQHSGFEGPVYPGASSFMYNGRTSPSMYPDDGEVRIPPSNLSTASAPSAPSSTVGSPNSSHGQLAFIPEYQQSGLVVNPGIVGGGEYFTGTEYSGFLGQGMEEFMAFDNKSTFVDPSLIHPEIRGPMAPPMPGYENANNFSPQNHHLNSPAVSGATSPAPAMRNGSQSPYLHGYHQQYSPFAVPPPAPRRQSLSSYRSHGSHEHFYNSDESEKKQRCPHPDCGKTFKDLKAHMLTHQTERPEKCPIQTCDYHVKGFARKYDKNRHTLTHYKGTMVCGFCPGSGSAAEKSFNRADVFKRHLTAVHGVEQTPPNSRKKSGSANSAKQLSGYAPDATGKCSTCSATFSNAQDFYEHLDDCVLRIVQQEDPAEAINAKRLAEVENDMDVHQTLEKNQLPLTTQTVVNSDEDDDDEMADDDDPLDEDFKARKLTSPTKKKGNPANGVQKSRGMTHSRGGVPPSAKTKGRKNRRDYPSSWGFDKGQMTMKKRVMTVFDGPRRLAKDDMMLSTEHEVRVKLSDGESYVTDLDVNTLQRAQGFLDATEQEKGIWISDDPTEEDMKRMLAMSQQ